MTRMDESQAAGRQGDARSPGSSGGRPTRDLGPVTERELAARARGLSSAYIPGGDDPELERTKRAEARYMRLLIGMVLLIVGTGLIVSLVGLAIAAGVGS
jgi:hypothetical protein